MYLYKRPFNHRYLGYVSDCVIAVYFLLSVVTQGVKVALTQAIYLGLFKSSNIDFV